MRKFSTSRDRRLTPFFAGRIELIGKIEAQCAEVHEAWREAAPSPAAGATQVVQGAPGVGKTALLDFMAGKWKGAKAPIPLLVEHERLDLASLLSAVAAAVRPRQAATLGRATRTTRTAQVGIGGSGLSATRETASPPPVEGGMEWPEGRLPRRLAAPSLPAA